MEAGRALCMAGGLGYERAYIYDSVCGHAKCTFRSILLSR